LKVYRAYILLVNRISRQAATATPEAQARRCRHLDAELSFCRSALSQGTALASRGEIELASRDAWLVEDTAHAIESVLVKVKDAERLDRYQRQLTYVQSGLNDLRRHLGMLL
jgi:hypothetical protein